jgi:ABC-2 type transport system ATP-binding protein
MKILTGFMPATSGRAKVAGFDVFEQPLEVKRRTGYLPEQPPVYNDLTVYAYLKFVAALKGVPSKRVKDEVERVANRTGIVDVMGRLIGNISKGYKQRVGLAQALLNDPQVLILDEPTVGLDPRQQREVRALIKELAGQHTIVLSTHILHEVTQTCQKALIIHKGKIVAFDTLDGLAQKHQGSLEEIFLKLTEDVEEDNAPAATPEPGSPASEDKSA